jgi:hypothetical protein
MNTPTNELTIAMRFAIEIDFIVVAVSHIGRGRGGRCVSLRASNMIAKLSGRSGTRKCSVSNDYTPQ